MTGFPIELTPRDSRQGGPSSALPSIAKSAPFDGFRPARFVTESSIQGKGK
jgi:hypothetical protein